MENCTTKDDIMTLNVAVGTLAGFCLFILIFHLVLFRVVWKRLKTLEAFIKTLVQTVTNDEIFAQDNEEYDGNEDQNNHKEVTTTDQLYPSSLNQVKVNSDVTETGGKRKKCKSDTELSMRNKLMLFSKLQNDIKERVVYEKCRLPFDNVQ